MSGPGILRQIIENFSLRKLINTCLQTNVAVMIVTTQAVFRVVKELLQSMLSYCHEDYHDSEDASNGYDAIETPQEDQGM